MAKVAQSEAQEQDAEAHQHQVDHGELHMTRFGECRAHTLVHVNQRIDQDEGLQPGPAVHRYRTEAGPLIVGSPQEGDGEDDEAEHQTDISWLEGCAQHEAEPVMAIDASGTTVTMIGQWGEIWAVTPAACTIDAMGRTMPPR